MEIEKERARIVANIAKARAHIAAACEKAGRAPAEVRLMLVTKTVPAEIIRLALEAGETLIGENRIQEALPKYEALENFAVERHFIGTLQTNKIKDALRFADVVQSVDRLKLAEKLNEALEKEGRVLPVYLEVNVSGEASKQGVALADAAALARQIAAFPALNLSGLMTIGALTDDVATIRRGFAALRELQACLRDEGFPTNELSMGMSGDMELAIAEGATMVRIGTAIFGARN